MPKSFKFNDRNNNMETTNSAAVYMRYGRTSSSPNASSIARQLNSLAAYASFAFNRQVRLYGDELIAERRRDAALSNPDMKRILCGVLHQDVIRERFEPKPSWMRPSFQRFLDKANAVRTGILVVRNVIAALRDAAKAFLISRLRQQQTAENAAAKKSIAVARLREAFASPRASRGYPPSEAMLREQRDSLQAQIVEAGRKRFLGYLAMERAKKLNSCRVNRARRFMAARPNRT